jgi:cell division protein FtsX
MITIATINFHSGTKIQKTFENEVQKEYFLNAISSDARFIKINNNLYAISSISSIEFEKREKEIRRFEDLSEENKKIFDTDPKAFPLYDIRKTLEQ